MINLPIAALASMNDLSDAAELASHAKNVQLLQCSLPSTNPSTVVIVPPTAADSKSFKVLVIDSKGSASVIELGSRPSGEAGWSFHMTDPSAARAAPFLRGVDCSAAISLAHYTDCKDIASPALMSLVLVLATDGRLILADTASGAVMAALPSTPKRGHRTNILSLLRVPTQSTPENAMFLVGLGSESSRNTAQEVLLVIERCDSFPDTSLPLSCLLLPLCLSGLRPVASCDTNRGSVLWPVGYNTTAMCSSFVLSSSEGTNELRAYTHADDVITAVTALVTGLSAVTNKGAAIAPENIAEASVDISFVIGCILGHAQNTARHRVEGFDKIQFSANLCSLLLNLPVSTKLSDVLSLARCVLCYYQNPPAHFIDQFLQKSESVRFFKNRIICRAYLLLVTPSGFRKARWKVR